MKEKFYRILDWLLGLLLLGGAAALLAALFRLLPEAARTSVALLIGVVIGYGHDLGLSEKMAEAGIASVITEAVKAS